MELDWNDPDTALRLIDDIAFRRGFGNVLADGAREASERFGEKSKDYLIWIKNLPQSDPVDLRFIKAYALGVATATRGADHLRSRCPWEAFEYDNAFIESIYGGPVESDPMGYRGKGRVVWWWESYLALFDALGLCKLLAFHCLPDPGVFDFEVFSKLIKAGSGLDISPEDVFNAGVGINNIERSFICREGVTRKDDYPPQRYFEPLKMQEGVDEQSKNTWLDRDEYDKMLTEYYICHRWNTETGIPCE
jgi:aldehyde:ferredoxin oxidoreductase